MSDIVGKMLGIVVALLFGVFVVSLWKACEYELNRPTLCGTVTSIGGCDKYGLCGVLTDNPNGPKRALYPAIGKQSCHQE